jgi:hypothetical protein
MQGVLTKLFATKCESISEALYFYIEFAPRWMSKEPAEIFERAAEDGFVAQVGMRAMDGGMCC